MPGENIEVSFVPSAPTGGFSREFVFVATGHYVKEESGGPAKMAAGGSAPLPTEFSLSQNYPNPFNPRTDIRYQIPDGRSPVHTTLKVYNIMGQAVATLVDGPRASGYYSVTWDAAGHASGIYFYRITTGEFTDTKRMVLMK